MNKIIIIVIVIVIIAIILLTEHFEITDATAFNNLITSINNGNVNLQNLTVSDKININDTNLLDLIEDRMNKQIYPVGSIWLSGKRFNPFTNEQTSFIKSNTSTDTNSLGNKYFYDFYDLVANGDNNCFSSSKCYESDNTPLKYGTWIMINYRGHDVMLGPRRQMANYKDDCFWGWRNIKDYQLPEHKHNIKSRGAEGGGTYRHYPARTSTHLDSAVFGETDGTYTMGGGKVGSQYTPASYLCFVYKKISDKKLDMNNSEDKETFKTALQKLNITFNDESGFSY